MAMTNLYGSNSYANILEDDQNKVHLHLVFGIMH